MADLIETGTLALGVTAPKDLADLKAACRGKLGVLVNLNAIEMRRWPSEIAETNLYLLQWVAPNDT